MLKEFQIKSFLKNKSISVIDSEIISTINLSSAFGSICEKIILKNDKQLVIKVQPLNNNKQYSSIYYEGKSLKKMHKKFSNIFPKVYHLEKKFFIMEWIEHNNVKNKSSEKDCAYKLSKLHSIGNKQYGYVFTFLKFLQ